MSTAAEVFTKEQRVLRISGFWQAAIGTWTCARTIHDHSHRLNYDLDPEITNHNVAKDKVCIIFKLWFLGISGELRSGSRGYDGSEQKTQEGEIRHWYNKMHYCCVRCSAKRKREREKWGLRERGWRDGHMSLGMTLNCFTDDWEVVAYARKGPLAKGISCW